MWVHLKVGKIYYYYKVVSNFSHAARWSRPMVNESIDHEHDFKHNTTEVMAYSFALLCAKNEANSAYMFSMIL